MAKSVKEAIESQKASLKSAAECAKDLRQRIKDTKLDVLFSALVALEPLCECYVGTYTVSITVPVKSMKHMMEVIEFAEKTTGIEFDQSSDDATSGVRRFSSNKAWWLSIGAEVSRDPDDTTALCRRVQTGIKTVEVPEYKLECSDPV